MKSNETPFLSLIPEHLQTPEFISAWTDWVDERRVRKNPVTKRAAQIQLNKCALWGPKRSVESIVRSIECGWTGLFEVQPSTRTPQPVRKAPTLLDRQLQELSRMIL